ncbi:MFS transporter [Amycolatopsis regifaucium]|uniref:MFS transporter n=1 Tax=Amycolatopsis regifaucium TaxID=546365 RepID=A0A154M598_9PSEU|nr:MFS transporter [Amycolatopsis regifaucium]KZB79736.1 MFS transporter [Amycolatopsis regifaucium]OKA09947.1 MFS transporter [Amycolatopsis regifaucium]SFI67974.1 MFS transporter, DHA2 family, multidrug resistance protein [Amycolatopsis regifaucium]
MTTARAERAVRARPLLAVLGAGLFLVAVDATVLHVALPDLVRQLRPGAAAQVWIVAIYPLTAAPLLLPFGTLGDRYGRRRVLVTGYVVFGVASLGCAFAPNVPVLLGFRALLGCGGAMIMPVTMSLLRELFPEQRQRRTAIAVCSGIAGTGSVFGPILGGVLVETWGWRATFLLNPPVILAAVVLALRWLPRNPPGRRPWDALSAGLAAGGVLGIAFAVGQPGSWLTAVVSGVAGCVLIGLFLRRQRRTDPPLLDLTLFRLPGVRAAVGGVLLVMSTLVGLGLLFAQYLQVVLGLSPTAAAARLLLVLGASAVGSVVTPALLERFGNARVRTAGFAVTALSLVVPSTGSAALTSPVLLGAGLTGLGLGMALALTSSTDTLLSATSADQAGGAAAVEKTGYELGAGFGTTLFGSLAAAVYAGQLALPAAVPDQARRLALSGPAQAETAASGLTPQLAVEVLDAARAACTVGLQVSAGVAGGVFLVAAVASRTRE